MIIRLNFVWKSFFINEQFSTSDLTQEVNLLKKLFVFKNNGFSRKTHVSDLVETNLQWLLYARHSVTGSVSLLEKSAIHKLYRSNLTREIQVKCSGVVKHKWMCFKGVLCLMRIGETPKDTTTNWRLRGQNSVHCNNLKIYEILLLLGTAMCVYWINYLTILWIRILLLRNWQHSSFNTDLTRKRIWMVR